MSPALTRSVDTFPNCFHCSVCGSQQTAAHTWHSNNHRTCSSSGFRKRVHPTPTTPPLSLCYNHMIHPDCSNTESALLSDLFPFMTSTYSLIWLFGNVVDSNYEWSSSLYVVMQCIKSYSYGLVDHITSEVSPIIESVNHCLLRWDS